MRLSDRQELSLAVVLDAAFLVHKAGCGCVHQLCAGCTVPPPQAAHAALFPIDYDDAFFARATRGLDRCAHVQELRCYACVWLNVAALHVCAHKHGLCLARLRTHTGSGPAQRLHRVNVVVLVARLLVSSLQRPSSCMSVRHW
jgi:hypothetical protein